MAVGCMQHQQQRSLALAYTALQVSCRSPDSRSSCPLIGHRRIGYGEQPKRLLRLRFTSNAPAASQKCDGYGCISSTLPVVVLTAVGPVLMCPVTPL